MLNPEAPEYIPISGLTLFELPFHIHVLPSMGFPVCPPPTKPPFTYPSQPPTCLTADCSSLPQDSTQSFFGFLSLPPPLAPDVAPTSDPESFIPLATREKTRVFSRTYTGGKFIPRKHPNSCSWRGGFRAAVRRRGRSCLDVDGKERSGLEFRGGRGVTLSESYDLKKHGIMPLKLDEEKTTIMIKNIPYELTRLNLVEFLDKHCMAENKEVKEGSSEEEGTPSISAYDFLYLPIDFAKKKNKGYAFVNFTESRAVWKFFHSFNGTKWDINNSPKIRRIVCARVQGKEALLKHFEKTYFDCESDEFLPACFSPPRDGSGASVELTTVGGSKGGKSLFFFSHGQGEPPH